MATIDQMFGPIATVLQISPREVARAARYCGKENLIPPGKPGPGGRTGTATAEAVANLLLGLLCTDSRQDAGIESGLYGSLIPVGRKDTFTGANRCNAALALVIANPTLASRIEDLVITREPRAEVAIVYDEAQRQEFAPGARKKSRAAIRKSVSLEGRALYALALVWADLQSEPEEDGEWTPTA